MTHYWKALILTQSNTLQNVEVETPGPWREDAIAQIQSMYGAKEVKTCVPLSKPSQSSSSSGTLFESTSDSAGAGLGLFVLVAVLLLIWALRWIILGGLIIGALYWMYKKWK
jgi:hypothetical protein